MKMSIVNELFKRLPMKILWTGIPKYFRDDITFIKDKKADMVRYHIEGYITNEEFEKTFERTRPVEGRHRKLRINKVNRMIPLILEEPIKKAHGDPLSTCHAYGQSGGCNFECPVLLRGECHEPEWIKHIDSFNDIDEEDYRQLLSTYDLQ